MRLQNCYCLILSMLLGWCCFTSAVCAQPLLVDFNSTTQDGDALNQEGYSAYDAAHEDIESFGTRTYDAFGTSIDVTPLWPNTTSNAVQQAIDRGAGNDANWMGDKLALLTDWIGSDSRTGNGGNGDWDRTDATTPTYMTLTLDGLPAGNYRWLSYHHDTEHMWSDFQIELSLDGGSTFELIGDNQITDSTPGGVPDSTTGTGLGPFMGDMDPDPANLPSTFLTTFEAGDDPVVFRFAPFVNGIDEVAVHKQFFAMNGFEIEPFGAPGDFNGDDTVDFQDFIILSSNFNRADGVEFSDGDINLDRVIDLSDFIEFRPILLGAETSAAAVPEPSSMILGGLSCLALAIFRRRRV